MSFEKLFSPMKIGNVEIKNRVVMAPMDVCLAPDENFINDRFVHYYAARAKGGCGLVTSTGMAVDRDTCSLPTYGGVYLTTHEDMIKAKRVVDLVHSYDSKFCFQLLHPGRQGSSSYSHGQQPVAPSSLKEADWSELPRSLEIHEIKSIANKYANSAELAFEAGADGVELHFAHGYLVHSFMSPRANKRTDEYGGSFENRMRFMTEIVAAVKAVTPEDRFISIRLNGRDCLEDGLTMDECLEIAKYVESLGIDAVSLSNGTYSAKDYLIEPQVWPEGCRHDMIKAYRDILSVPLIAANHIKRPAHAEEMLKEDLCDFVALGRPMLADPDWANKAKDCKTEQIRYCVSCGSCNAHTALHLPNMCAMNPKTMHEYKYNDSSIRKNGKGKTVVVIGGGIGGMEAATLAAERGFSVTLFCKDSHLGGTFNLGTYAPGMEKKAWAVHGYISRLMAAGVNVKLNTEIKSAEQVLELNPYAVAVAVGGTPVMPELPGIAKPIVKQACDVAANAEAYKDKNVIFVGSGLAGLEISYTLAAKGAKLKIFEAADVTTPNAKGVSENKNKAALIKCLTDCGTVFNTSKELVEVTDKGAKFCDAKTNEVTDVEGDVVVLSLGMKPNKTVEKMLKGKVEKLVIIGDCAGSRRVFEATHSAYESVWKI